MEAALESIPPAASRAGRPLELGRLRVALVHDWLTGRRGGEKCLEVLCRIFPGAVIHTLLHRPGSVGPTIEGMSIRTSPLQRLPSIDRHYRHLLPLMPLAARSWRVGQVDLVVSLSHCVAKAVRSPTGVPHVCYCFTPMRYAWEGREAYFESWSGRPVRRAVAGAMLDRLRSWDRSTASRVSHFVAISETVRGRIARCYGRESRVIQPPVDTTFYTPAAAASREPFYLCVSALVAYKRIDQAVEACTRSGRSLVVIGEGPERARLEGLAGPNVRFLGWQPDDVIRDHYRRCRALLFPAEEDFGIVPIEALACGTPVIALGQGGVAETVDDRVGRVYAGATADRLLGALAEWEQSGCPWEAQRARAKAEAYSTARFEERLAAYLVEVVSGSPRDPIPPPHHLGAAPAGVPTASRLGVRTTSRSDLDGKGRATRAD